MQGFVKHAVLPVSFRASKFEIVIGIELQELNLIVRMQIWDCLKPFFGSKKMDPEGVWHSIFSQALADALRMNQTITQLFLDKSKIGDDDLKAWWWSNTGNPRSFF